MISYALVSFVHDRESIVNKVFLGVQSFIRTKNIVSYK